MSGMTRSALELRIERQLAESIALLKQANRYVGTFASIGAQDLSIKVTEFIAATERQGESHDRSKA